MSAAMTASPGYEGDVIRSLCCRLHQRVRRVARRRWDPKAPAMPAAWRCAVAVASCSRASPSTRTCHSSRSARLIAGCERVPLFLSEHRPGPHRLATTDSRDICPGDRPRPAGLHRARVLLAHYADGMGLHQLRHSSAIHLQRGQRFRQPDHGQELAGSGHCFPRQPRQVAN
jgi:hypothetical protein